MERERYGVSDDKEAECMSLVSPSVSLVLHSLSISLKLLSYSLLSLI